MNQVGMHLYQCEKYIRQRQPQSLNLTVSHSALTGGYSSLADGSMGNSDRNDWENKGLHSSRSSLWRCSAMGILTSI